VLPANEGRRGALLDVDSDATPDARRPPDRDRLGLALECHRLELFVLDDFVAGVVGELADDDATHGSDRLQARRRVHDVAGDYALAPLGACPQCDDGLTAIHGRPNSELKRGVRLVQLPNRIEDAQRSSHGALGVVLVRDRRAEHRHDSVADELLDRTLEALDLPL
jgi:hypothetical protein